MSSAPNTSLETLPILLADPISTSQKVVVFERHAGQLVDLSRFLANKATFLQSENNLLISAESGEKIIIEGFFQAAQNEFYILIGNGPLLTAGQFISVTPLQTEWTQVTEGETLVEDPSEQPTETSQDPSAPPPSSARNYSDALIDKLPALDREESQSKPSAFQEDQQSTFDLSQASSAVSFSSSNRIRLPDIPLYVQPDSQITQPGVITPARLTEADLHASSSITAQGSLALDFGEDGANSRALLFALDPAGRPLSNSGEPLSLTSSGARVLFQTETGAAGEHILTALTPKGTLVFRVVLDPSSESGTYFYEQFAPLDHYAGSTELALSFRFIARDADGDELLAGLEVMIEDAPLPTYMLSEASLSEAGLLMGSGNDPNAASASGRLPQDPVGEALTYTWADMPVPDGFVYQVQGNTLLVLQQGKLVLSAALNGQSGEYLVTQHLPINHGGADSIVFNLKFEAARFRGQSTIGDLLVTAQDDAPIAFPLNQIVFDDSTLPKPTDGQSSSIHHGQIQQVMGADGGSIKWSHPDNPEGLRYDIQGDTLSVYQGDTLIITASFTSSEGHFNVQQHNPLKHALESDSALLTLTYELIDADGDITSGSIQLEVQDELPQIGAPEQHTLFESDLLATSEAASLPETSSSSSLTGQLPSSNGNESVSYSWTETPLPQGFVWGIAGDTLSLYESGILILSAQLNPQTGAYTLQHHNALNHTSSTGEFSLGFLVTDVDGDTVASGVSIRIEDDGPTLNQPTSFTHISEHSLFEAINDGASYTSQSTDLNIDWGADGPQSLRFSSALEEVSAGFFSEGSEVFYSLNPSASELTGQLQDGTVVLKVTLSSEGSGSYSVQLYTPIDHANGETQLINLESVARDGDGDVLAIPIKIAIEDGRSQAVADNFTGTEDTTLLMDLIGNDKLSGEAYVVRIEQAPLKGHLSENTDGTFSYEPHPNTFGSDSFTYFIEDKAGTTSAPVTVSLQINGANDTPIFVGATPGVPTYIASDDNMNEPLFTANAQDADGDTLDFFLGGADQALFEIDQETGQVSWKQQPDYSANGSNLYSITVIARDSHGAQSQHNYQVEVLTNQSNQEPMVNLYSRGQGDHIAAIDLSSSSLETIDPSGLVTQNWREVGDETGVDRPNQTGQISIDEQTGHLIFKGGHQDILGGPSLTASMDLSGGSAASLTVQYSLPAHSTNAFHIVARQPDGTETLLSTLPPSDLTNGLLELQLPQALIGKVELHIISADTSSESDLLRLSSLSVKLSQTEEYQQQHSELTYDLNQQDLAVAKSASLQTSAETVSKMQIRILGATEADSLQIDPHEALSLQQTWSDTDGLLLELSGNLATSEYQSILQSLTFSTTSSSLAPRSLLISIETENGVSAPSIISIRPQATDQPSSGQTFLITGDDANNILVGTDGDDTIKGHAGDDRLAGGLGADTLIGGEGSDLYIFRNLEGAADRIRDFETRRMTEDYSQDAIYLEDLFTADQIATIKLRGAKNYLKLEQVDEGKYELYADTDGKKTAFTWELATTLETTKPLYSGEEILVTFTEADAANGIYELVQFF